MCRSSEYSVHRKIGEVQTPSPESDGDGFDTADTDGVLVDGTHRPHPESNTDKGIEDWEPDHPIYPESGHRGFAKLDSDRPDPDLPRTAPQLADKRGGRVQPPVRGRLQGVEATNGAADAARADCEVPDVDP